MPAVDLDLLFFAVLLCVLVAALLGVLWTWVWALRQLWLGVPLLAHVRPMPALIAPWRASTIVLTVLLYLLVNCTVIRTYEAVTGRHLPKVEDDAGKLAPERKPEKMAEPPRPAATKPGQPGEEPGAERPFPRAEGAVNAAMDPSLQTQGELMLQSAIINLLLLVLVPAFLFWSSGATFADLGLRIGDWQRQVMLGVQAAMLMTPVVFAVQNLSVKIWTSQKHPLQRMMLERFTPGAALLAILSAMVLAPLIEELLFRVVLQQWLTRLFMGNSFAKVGASQLPGDSGEAEETWDSVEGFVEPGQRTSIDIRPSAEMAETSTLVPAILVTSFLFASMHYSQWPAPIAIFVLALGLGTVYHRSGSLITVMVMHGTFNGFSTVMLLLDALGRKMTIVPPQAVAWSEPGVWTHALAVACVITGIWH
jgi:membrane protease YdiL (CAAX protease family)